MGSNYDGARSCDLLSLTKEDRVRMLSAVSRKGAAFTALRIVVITISLALLVMVPVTGLARVDLWGGDHLLLGESVDFFAALKGSIIAMAIMYGGTFISNMIVGRFFCGWGCPVGYVARFGEDVANSRSKLQEILMHLKGASFVATFIIAVMLWWVDPRVMIDGSPTAKAVTAGIFLIMTLGGLGHAFIWRFGFCIHVCPIGLYYRLVTSKAPVGIVFKEIPNPCIECGACEKICPVKIDPKALGTVVEQKATGFDEEPERYGDAECIRCGDCIEACKMVFSKEAGAIPPLRFGRVDEHDSQDTSSASSP